MTFVITTHTHRHKSTGATALSGHRHGGSAKPVAPEECRARHHCTLGIRRDSGYGAVCHGTLHTTVCADYPSAIRSRSIAFVPGLLSCTLCKKCASSRIVRYISCVLYYDVFTRKRTVDRLQQHRCRVAICAGPLTRAIGQIELYRG